MRYESRQLASALPTRRQPAGELKRRRCEHAHKDQCRCSENLRGEHGERTVTKGSDGREQTCVQGVAVVVDADQVDVEDPSSLAVFDRQALKREHARAARGRAELRLVARIGQQHQSELRRSKNDSLGQHPIQLR